MKGILKKTGLAVLLTAVLLFGTALSAFAAQATINDDGTRVRSDSSTDSNVVVTASKGQAYTVLDTVTGADGNTWYKIQVSDSSVGYVRGDLVSVTEDAGDDSPSEVTSASPVTAIVPFNVTTNNTANIRSGAGTDYEKVGTIESGTEITLTGEATASDGYKWYEMNCESKSITGYIRSDFVDVNEADIVYGGGDTDTSFDGGDEYATDEVDDAFTQDETHNDYEIVYTTDDDGVYQYYLYNHIDNTKQKVESLLEAVNTLNEKYKEANSKLSTFKVLTILFGALAVVATILAVFFFLRTRNGEYEYDEEDFEETPKESVKAKERPQEKEKTSRPQQGSANADRPRKNPEKASSEGDRPRAKREEAAEKAPERKRAERPADAGNAEAERNVKQRPRRPQNFLADDDDLEFEFLDMDE